LIVDLLLISILNYCTVDKLRKHILTKEIADKKLRRIALELVERNYDEPQLVLLGVKDSGIIIAGIIAGYLKQSFNGEVLVVSLSLDKQMPAAVTIEPPVNLNDKVVVLIDDVANSGKTMLYSLKPLLNAYPKKIQTAALVERTHKSFPVALDYVGLSISTTLDEHIYVEVNDGEVKGAWMEQR
jgi:pyrimidine operon attenuation protein / uracil phosphoribosyltransferase